MGNVSARDGEEIAGSDAAGMRTFSSSMMLESPVPARPPPSEFTMSSSPPDTRSPLMPVPMTQAAVYNADDAGIPWNNQMASSSNEGGNAVEGPGIAALIEWKHGGSDVAVKGSWDNWSTRSVLQRSGKDYAILMFLPAGIYHYKFLVDGEQRHSLDLPFVLDEHGNGINILEVKDNVEDNLDGVKEEFVVPSSPESSYNNPYPGMEDYSKDPPVLPPQLYLNSHLESAQHVLSSIPSLQGAPFCNAVKPHHVVLNHLFVETKRASWNPPVLALGFTQRFRAKHVTLILHKPLRR